MQDGSQKQSQGVYTSCAQARAQCSGRAVDTSTALVAENATQSIIDPWIFRRGVHDHFPLAPRPAHYVKGFTRMSNARARDSRRYAALHAASVAQCKPASLSRRATSACFAPFAAR